MDKVEKRGTRQIIHRHAVLRPSAMPLSEQTRAGKAARARAPRSAPATWTPRADRPDPIGLLQAGDHNRLPDLVPIRYGRMLESPFAFLRGAAAVMAADLATTPTTGFTVQACGDAHLANFGIYGTPERNLVFDLNDFDETLPGPWEWDLKRLAASVAVAGRANNLPDNACADAAYSAVRSYHESIATLAQAGYINAWYQRVDAVAVLDILYGGSRKQVRRRLARAGRRDNLHALDRMTKVMDGRLRIVDDPPLVTHVGTLSSIDARRRCCAATAGRCRSTGARCLIATPSWTSPARWSAWAASARAATSSCW